MAIVFQCDCCKKNYNSEFSKGIKFYSKDIYQNCTDGVYYDLCEECMERVNNLLKEIREENENVEKETFEEVDTDVKKMTIEEAKGILEKEWCCECKRYSNNVCDMIIPSGTKSCVDCILENLTPIHFKRKKGNLLNSKFIC